MQIDEDVLREMKSAVFNSGVSPARSYVEFFAEAMRWPVAAFAPRTVSGISHEVTWLNGSVIGRATCSTSDEAPEVKAAVHPLTSVTRVDIGSTVRDDGLSPDIMRSLTVHFVDGESLTIDLTKFTSWMQREQADAFIDAVLDWVVAQESE